MRLTPVLAALALLAGCEGTNQDRPHRDSAPAPGMDTAPRPDSLAEPVEDPVDDTIGMELPRTPPPVTAGPSQPVAPVLRAVTLRTVLSLDTTQLADTTKAGDTVIVSYRTRVRSLYQDSLVRRVLTPSLAGVPWGPYAFPPDSFCAKLGYSGTIINPAQVGVNRTLARAKACGFRVGFTYPRRIMQQVLLGQGIQKAVAYVSDSLPRAGTRAGDSLDAYVRDGTFNLFWAGDDIGDGTRPEWGTAPVEVQQARWDSLAWAVKQRWPGMVTVLRALPTQMSHRSEWKWVEAAAVQYLGQFKRHGPPGPFFQKQDSVARRMGLGLILGVNMLNGGCGPNPAECYDGVKGMNLPGTRDGLWALSPAEYVYYHKKALEQPGVCAIVGWAWSPAINHPLHTRSDIQAAGKEVGKLATGRLPASCVR